MCSFLKSVTAKAKTKFQRYYFNALINLPVLVDGENSSQDIAMAFATNIVCAHFVCHAYFGSAVFGGNDNNIILKSIPMLENKYKMRYVCKEHNNRFDKLSNLIILTV